MTKEVLKLALEALEVYWGKAEHRRTKEDESKAVEAITAIKEALAQPVQEPVAMKFKIYLPVKHQINHANLPWVYDQDRSTGSVASMWVTPVATLPPQHKETK